MDMRFLGPTGVKVSRLCLGTMTFGDPLDREQSKAVFQAARELGINSFDCANVYAKGESERVLGELIQDCRDEVFIASKVYFPTSEDENARGLSRFHIQNAVQASLKRLNTDRIDLLYFHRYDPKTQLTESLRAVDDLVRAGKVRYLGLSNFSAWQAMKALGLSRQHGWTQPVCLQPMYNLAKRQAEVEILPMAESEGLAVMNYSPLGGGLFTGKYRANKRPAQGRLIDSKMYQVRYGDQGYYELAEAFCQKAEELGHHPVPLAIAWTAAHPAVTSAILGVKSVEQLRLAVQALSIDMTAELYADLAALSPRPAPATDRNEESSAHNYGSR